LRFTRSSGRDYRIQYLYFLSLFSIFLILLFFVLIMPDIISLSGLSVSLPRVISSEAVGKKGFIITILKDDTIYLTEGLAQDKASSAVSKTRRVALIELKNFLDSVNHKGYQVLIKADKDAHLGIVIKVWDIFRQAGASKVNIATDG